MSVFSEISHIIFVLSDFLSIYTLRSGTLVFKKGCQRNPLERSPVRIQGAKPCSRFFRNPGTVPRFRSHYGTVECSSGLRKKREHGVVAWVRMDGSVGWVALAFLLAANLKTSDIWSCAKKIFVSLKICIWQERSRICHCWNHVFNFFKNNFEFFENDETSFLGLQFSPLFSLIILNHNCFLN